MVGFRFSLFIVAVSIGGSASAADIHDSTAQSQETFSWSGPYVGLLGGANFLSGRTFIPNYAPGQTLFHADSSSIFIGGKVGFSHQFESNVVVGLEGSLIATFNGGEDATGGGATGEETIHVGADWQGQIVGKAGYALDRSLLYVKGGVAFIHLNEIGYRSLSSSDPLDRLYTGWTVGFGADHALTDNWIVGVDYSYSDFGDHDFDNAQIGPTIVEPTTHTLTFSAAYKF